MLFKLLQYINITLLWLLVLTLIIHNVELTASDPDHFALIKNRYNNDSSLLNQAKIRKYIKMKDSVSIQLLYSNIRDIGLYLPKAGLMLTDSLLKISREVNDRRGIISAYNMYGQLYTQIGEYELAFDNYFKSISFGDKYIEHRGANEVWDKHGCSLYYLGGLYFELGDVETAFTYYSKSKDVFSVVDDRLLVKEKNSNRTLNRDYTTYLFDKATAEIGYLKCLFELKRFDEFKLGLDSILIFKDKLDTRIVFDIENLEYKLLRYNHQSSSADSMLLTLFQSATTQGFNSEISKLALEMLEYEVYPDSVSRYKMIAIGILNSEKSLNLKTKRDLMLIRSKYYRDLNQFEDALIDLEVAFQLNDSLGMEEVNKKMGVVISDLRNSHKLKQIETEKENIESRSQIIIIISIILLVILIMIGLLYAKLRKLNLELKTKNELIKIQHTKLNGLNNNKLEIYKRLSHDLINSIYQMETITNRITQEYNYDELLKLNKSVVGLKSQFSVILEYARKNLDGSKFSQVDIILEDMTVEILNLNTELMNRKNLSYDIDFQLNTIKANYEGLFVIILNLIHNAIKFSNNGGRILVKTYTEDDFQIIKIQDFGIGFSKESLTRVNSGMVPLERTSTEHMKGSGIGLLSVFETAKNMDITILFESELTRGATVYLYIPTDK